MADASPPGLEVSIMIYDWLFLLLTDELIAAFTFLEISFCAIIMGVGAVDTDY